VAEPAKFADLPMLTQLKRAPIQAVQPAGDEVELAQVVTPPPAQAEAATSSPVTTLPSTASEMPLIGISGLLALGAFAVVRKATARLK
jgi:hypothetical protein